MNSGRALGKTVASGQTPAALGACEISEISENFSLALSAADACEISEFSEICEMSELALSRRGVAKRSDISQKSESAAAPAPLNRALD